MNYLEGLCEFSLAVTIDRYKVIDWKMACGPLQSQTIKDALCGALLPPVSHRETSYR